MAVLLFKLRHVPDDEAEEIRDLLTRHGIEFYETSAGIWRISLPGIWLPTADQLPLAQRLLDEFQQQRYLQARQHYESLKAAGRQRTLLSMFRENPLHYGLYCGLIAVVLYLSLQWFLGY
ncbi:MAG: hypothetical protein RLZZ385_2652 [Pseudomonadota bacterium]|jgi:hypothetical protein